MDRQDLSRRGLLRSAMAMGSLALSPEILDALPHAHSAAAGGPASLGHFDAQTAAEVEAMASAIIPTDDTPGAKEAGVIFFIDRALATFDQDKRELYRKGLAEAEQKRQALYPDSKSIAGLSSEHRTALLQAIEKSEFFETLRTHVIIGFMARPEWGGNRDKAGWKLIGFEDAMSFQPPFGYYDAPGRPE